MARRFVLIRDEHDGVNSPGVVAEGILFQSGKVSINWVSHPHSVHTYDTLADLMVVQNKNGITRIQWLDGSEMEVRVQSVGRQRLQNAQEHLGSILGQAIQRVTIPLRG